VNNAVRVVMQRRDFVHATRTKRRVRENKHFSSFLLPLVRGIFVILRVVRASNSRFNARQMLAASLSNSSGTCIAIRWNAFTWIHSATRTMSYWSRTTLSRDDGGGGELVVAEDDIFETLGCLGRMGKIRAKSFPFKTARCKS